MTDIVSPAKRSRMMAGIGRANTAPEMLVRRYLHGAGLRFRVNDRSLPGSPDLVFTSRRVVVFVHGCFWHRHTGCKLAATPSTRTGFWTQKFAANMRRDKETEAALVREGWTVLTIWECQARNMEELDQLFWQIVGT